MRTATILAALAVGGLTAAVTLQEKKKAPELDGATGWLNTDKPLTIAGLRGKIVLLDFWTYC